MLEKSFLYVAGVFLGWGIHGLFNSWKALKKARKELAEAEAKLRNRKPPKKWNEYRYFSIAVLFSDEPKSQLATSAPVIFSQGVKVPETESPQKAFDRLILSTREIVAPFDNAVLVVQSSPTTVGVAKENLN